MRLAFSLLALAILQAGPAGAATHTFCIGSAAALADALAGLSNTTDNTDADEIRIRTGTYLAPAGGWKGAVTTHHDLTIRGGYTDAGCTQQSMNAALTVLDGHKASGVLTIDTPGLPLSNIEVSGLTFQNGRGGNAFESSAGGLKIGDPNPISFGRILVERNIFRENSADGNGFSKAVGGLLAATDGDSLVVRGNLFVGNSSPNAPAGDLESNSVIDVSNNTFIDNTATDNALPGRVMLDYFTFAGLKLSNNIFWGNATGPGVYDVDLNPMQFTGQAGATLRNNDIEAPTGTPVAQTGTRQVDPRFVAPGNFRLSHDSPLIDAGVNDADGGLAAVDLDGAPRVVGTAVDIGAYESGAPMPPAINGGISGNWYNPTPGQGGHGFQIEVLPDNGMLAIWFVFNPAGTAQNWIYSQGSYDPNGSSATLPAFLEQGGAFPPNFDGSKVTAPAWGSLQFTFGDCDHGTVAWKSNAASAAAGYADTTFPITRVTRIAGTTCP
jgi:Right handed beta helix region